MKIGFDTGFFVLLAKGDKKSVELLSSLKTPARTGVISALTIFELKRLILMGKVDKKVTETYISQIPEVFRIVWVEDIAVLEKAAALSVGVGLSSLDALILASLLEEGVEKIYTTDRDFEAYNKKGVEIINLRR